MAHPTRTQLLQENAFLKERVQLLQKGAAITAIAGVANTFFRWAGIVLSIWLAEPILTAFAGKVSIADLKLQILLDDTPWYLTALPWMAVAAAGLACGFVGVGYGFRQRGLRKSKTEYLQGRIIELEEHLDPERSSSNLTARGETNPEDQG